MAQQEDRLHEKGESIPDRFLGGRNQAKPRIEEDARVPLRFLQGEGSKSQEQGTMETTRASENCNNSTNTTTDPITESTDPISASTDPISASSITGDTDSSIVSVWTADKEVAKELALSIAESETVEVQRKHSHHQSSKTR